MNFFLLWKITLEHNRLTFFFLFLSNFQKFAYDVSFLVRTFTARIRGVETYQQKERLLADEFEQFERFEFIAKWIYYDDETKYHIIDI